MERFPNRPNFVYVTVICIPEGFVLSCQNLPLTVSPLLPIAIFTIFCPKLPALCYILIYNIFIEMCAYSYFLHTAE